MIAVAVISVVLVAMSSASRGRQRSLCKVIIYNHSKDVLNGVRMGWSLADRTNPEPKQGDCSEKFEVFNGIKPGPNLVFHLNTDTPYFKLLYPDAKAKFDLRLMPAVGDINDIPKSAKTLIIVANVRGVLHFRVFDGDGGTLDADESRLTDEAGTIADLRKRLENLWPPRRLGEEEKVQVINAVTSVIGHNPNAKAIDGEDYTYIPVGSTHTFIYHVGPVPK
jgi:hypothetical protein